ncbi:hypothetical protein LZD49_26255 [Dyadobacter sp. CY261]|uniref:hypothetical protein n=1 Tax=Dyadobacter sp. CY261 TaxID=2907203 RepID=UPI001F325684|nr:hypothetical protein [Dyadobacter sp. CY261]MCF0074012.1 hypothetical protein [Dyadobacter sp. CY261]
MILNADKVNEVFKSCLFQDGEGTDNYIVGYGVNIKVGFHPDRLLAQAKTIDAMLSELPDTFKRSGGGGMSFMNMCESKEGNLWTGAHRTMDQLVCLGSAIGKVSFPMPREMWSYLPGGMPYILIHD